MNFLRKVNRGNFYLSSHSFPLIHNFSTLSPKLRQLGQNKNTGTWGVNTTVVPGGNSEPWPANCDPALVTLTFEIAAVHRLFVRK